MPLVFRRRRICSLVAVQLVAATACVDYLDVNAGIPITRTPVDGGDRSDAALNPSDATSAGADADRGRDSARRPFGPLVVSSGGGAITCRVDGFFTIEFTADRGYKPSSWLDLGLPNNPNLAPAFFEPFEGQAEGVLMSTQTEGESGTLIYKDESPVRVTFDAWAHHVLPSGADAKVTTHFAVYASARVHFQTRVSNAGTAPLVISDGWKHSSLRVDPARAWRAVDGTEGSSFFLDAPNGTGITTLLRSGGVPASAGSATERHWTDTAATVAPDQEFSIVPGEIQLGVVESEAAMRIADARAPALEALVGLTRIDSGYNHEGAYELAAAASRPLSASLSPLRARAQPAFDIKEFDAPGFRILLNGQEIASSASPVTARGAARYVASERKLVFVYFGTIPINASQAERTFTIE